MAIKKSLLERIAEMQQKKVQLDNQIKLLMQKHKEADRKTRTHRLIERGALLESLINGAESFTNEQIRDILTAALTSRNAADTVNDMHGHRRVERAMEPVIKDEPIRRREPPGISEELRRPRV